MTNEHAKLPSMLINPSKQEETEHTVTHKAPRTMAESDDIHIMQQMTFCNFSLYPQHAFS